MWNKKKYINKATPIEKWEKGLINGNKSRGKLSTFLPSFESHPFESQSSEKLQTGKNILRLVQIL